MEYGSLLPHSIFPAAGNRRLKPAPHRSAGALFVSAGAGAAYLRGSPTSSEKRKLKRVSTVNTTPLFETYERF